MNQPNDVQLDVARTIKRLLVTSQSSQKRLAGYLEKDPSTITQRLKGDTEMTIRDLARIAEFFDVPTTVFLMNEDELDEWLATPGQLRRLRQRAAVIDLRDDLPGDSPLGWTATVGPAAHVVRDLEPNLAAQALALA